MRVAVNAAFWGQETTGSGQYLHNLLQGLMEVDPTTELVLIVPRWIESGRSTAEASAGGGVELLWCETPFDRINENLAKVWFEQISYPVACGRTRADLAFVPYYGPPLWSPVPVAVTIHDLIPLILPEYGSSPLVRIYMHLAAVAARRARVILADSRSSRDDVLRLLGASPGRVHVVYLAAGGAYRETLDKGTADAIRESLGLPERYFLYCGGFDVRKSLGAVMAGYGRARERHGLDEGIWLVVAGRLPAEDTEFTPDPRRIAHRLGLADRIVFTGWVEESDKPALYGGALGFLYVSAYEGFGLPVLEAMSCGTPAIVSDSSSLPEVVGGGGLIVPVGDVDAIAEAMGSVARDADLRESLRRSALAQASQFSWRKTAEDTMRFFRRAMLER